MAYYYGNNNAGIAVWHGTIYPGRYRNGMVLDAVLHCQPHLFRRAWIPLRQECPPDVEPSFGIVHGVPHRGMAVLRHQGGMVCHICHNISGYRMVSNGNKPMPEEVLRDRQAR